MTDFRLKQETAESQPPPEQPTSMAHMLDGLELQDPAPDVVVLRQRARRTPRDFSLSQTAAEVRALLQAHVGKHHPVTLALKRPDGLAVIGERLIQLAVIDLSCIQPRIIELASDEPPRPNAQQIYLWVRDRFDLERAGFLQEMYNYEGGLSDSIDLLTFDRMQVVAKRRLRPLLDRACTPDEAHDLAMSFFVARSKAIRRSYDPGKAGYATFVSAECQLKSLRASTLRSIGLDKRTVLKAELIGLSEEIDWEDDVVDKLVAAETVRSITPSDEMYRHEVLDESLASIAQSSGQTESAVTSKLYRERRNWRRSLGPYPFGDRD